MKTVRYTDSQGKVRDGILDGYTIDWKYVFVRHGDEVVKVLWEKAEIKDKKTKYRWNKE